MNRCFHRGSNGRLESKLEVFTNSRSDPHGVAVFSKNSAAGLPLSHGRQQVKLEVLAFTATQLDYETRDKKQRKHAPQIKEHLTPHPIIVCAPRYEAKR